MKSSKIAEPLLNLLKIVFTYTTHFWPSENWRGKPKQPKGLSFPPPHTLLSLSVCIVLCRALFSWLEVICNYPQLRSIKLITILVFGLPSSDICCKQDIYSTLVTVNLFCLSITDLEKTCSCYRNINSPCVNHSMVFTALDKIILHPTKSSVISISGGKIAALTRSVRSKRSWLRYPLTLQRGDMSGKIGTGWRTSLFNTGT